MQLITQFVNWINKTHKVQHVYQVKYTINVNVYEYSYMIVVIDTLFNLHSACAI